MFHLVKPKWDFTPDRCMSAGYVLLYLKFRQTCDADASHHAAHVAAKFLISIPVDIDGNDTTYDELLMSKCRMDKTRKDTRQELEYSSYRLKLNAIPSQY